MVEIIVLSEDEDDELPKSMTGSTGTSERDKDHPRASDNTKQHHNRPYKLVLVDSRRCPRMPRPRYLPITLPHEVLSGPVEDDCDQPVGSLDCRGVHVPAEALGPLREIEDEEGDPDYEDVRPSKRRRTGEKKVPKKHGRLTAPDLEVVRSGCGGRHCEKGATLLAKSVVDRKEARDYVKRMTANVDWEGTLRHLETLNLSATTPSAGNMNQQRIDVKSRHGQSQANRLKQYWQRILVKSVLKTDVNAMKQ